MSSHHYYLDLYIIEFKKFKDMLAEKDKLYGTLYIDLKKNSKIELKYKSDYDSFINANEMYYEMVMKLNEQEAVVKYLEEVMNTIRKMSFNIANIIELKKLKEGISWTVHAAIKPR